AELIHVDVIALAGVGLGADAVEAGGDDDDEALSEIEEFIRVAVLLLHGDVVLASRHRQRLN
ncbi:hypothetical protein, partial [Mesorhizobium sp. M8A.F.Ca.ET.161.01.1.1]|uniref:hypothetical protein n=1 Tax=Mesorhizobium sp. M8A.F.Ca.ET.161.01.1.1 TaxID=2563959 RepID=UPI001AEEDEC8